MLILVYSFLWWGLTTAKLMKQIEDTQLKIAAMCIVKELGESRCSDSMNEISDLKYRLLTDRFNHRKQMQEELVMIIEKYGVK